MAKAGRPRKWRNMKALQQAVDQYFDDCAERKAMPCQAGLALALGFHSRQALDRYTDRESAEEPEDRMVGIITRAKTRIEVENVQASYRKESARGAIFALESMGYSHKQDVAISGKGIEDYLQSLEEHGEDGQVF